MSLCTFCLAHADGVPAEFQIAVGEGTAHIVLPLCLEHERAAAVKESPHYWGVIRTALCAARDLAKTQAGTST